MRNIVFNWAVSDCFGWGVYGLNLLNWTLKDPRYRIIAKQWPPLFLHPINPLLGLELRKLETSWKKIVWHSDDIFLTSLGNCDAQRQSQRRRAREWGVIFFESNPLPKSELERLQEFDGIVTGSSWNRDKLRQWGIASELVIQGIDTDLFRPQPKRLFRDRFVVFSGGKLEFRKGQDIALRAFSIFSKRNKDAILVTAWRSPFEDRRMELMNFSNVCVPLVWSADAGRSIDNWILANGVGRGQFINLNAVPNRLMPEIYREVDVAIFTSRCEGGTNLVAMEAASCGVTCIISKNTGHLDIFTADNCFNVEQRVVDYLSQDQLQSLGFHSVLEWGESSIDQIVDLMERAYTSGRTLGAENIHKSVAHLTWEKSIGSLLQVVGGREEADV
jgi:glycosyltransferase involved in cell wall biosynthesis